MTIRKLIETNLVNNDTNIIIKRRIIDKKYIIATGKWFEDRIIEYAEYNIDTLTWEKENKIYIDIDEDDIIYGQTCDLND